MVCGFFIFRLYYRQMVRAMPAKLGGNHKAKLASCLAIHRNSILFPMRDCIVSCDPHTGARLQRFPLPPFAPTFDDLPVTAPSIISKFELASPNVIPQAALSDPEAWIMSSFLLSGDMLFVATYHVFLYYFYFFIFPRVGWVFLVFHMKPPRIVVRIRLFLQKKIPNYI